MPEDLSIDEAYRAGASIAELADLHGCSSANMRNQLAKLGVQFRRTGIYSRHNVSANERAALVARYAAGESVYELAAATGRSYAPMYRNLQRWGATFRRTGPKRQLAVNEHFFKTIDTELKAYWLGFIEADGHVRSSGLSVELAVIDKTHLEKLKQALQTEAEVKVTKRGIAARLQVHSHILRDDLDRQLSALTVPPRLLRHYFRGLFDGDGCLSHSITTKSWTFGQLGSEMQLTELKKWLLAQTGRTGGKLHFHGGIWKTHYTGNRQVPVIMALLYDGATVFLDRKAAKVAEMNRQLSIDVNRKTAYTARQEVRNNV